jgi:NhaP-type Na+/H+ or K+/H+ antiporter
MKDIFKDFNMITMESSFMLRTFFFVIFGITISISALFDNLVILISFGILAIIYGIRWLWLRIVLRKDFNTQLFLAPRGLITILLFFAIPKEFQISEFNEGILLFVIIFSSLIMAGALMRNSKKKEIVEEIETPIEGDSQEVEVTE